LGKKKPKVLSSGFFLNASIRWVSTTGEQRLMGEDYSCFVVKSRDYISITAASHVDFPHDSVVLVELFGQRTTVIPFDPVDM
jgi:hypothetical protein